MSRCFLCAVSVVLREWTRDRSVSISHLSSLLREPHSPVRRMACLWSWALTATVAAAVVIAGKRLLCQRRGLECGIRVYHLGSDRSTGHFLHAARS